MSQTTNTLDKFDKISSIIKDKGKDVKIFNTICNATNLRQTAAEKIGKKK